MSYDLHILRFDEVPADPQALMGQADFEPPVIGPVAEVRAAVDRCMPGLIWVDDSPGPYATTDLEDEYVEFDLGDPHEVRCLRVSGRFLPSTLARIIDLCRANGWQIFDPQLGKFITAVNEPVE